MAQPVSGTDDGSLAPARDIRGDNLRDVLKTTTVTETLDIDADNATAALTDGLLVMRYLFGLRGAALVQGALGGAATRSTTDIQSYLSGLTTGAKALDIDGNGSVDALTDGLLVVRYLFGMRGTALTQGAIGAFASRTDSTTIEPYMAMLTGSTPQMPSGCTVTAAPVSSATSPLPPGTPVQLTATCTAGQFPTTFTWDGGAYVGSLRDVAPNATTTYSVVASNLAGSSPVINITVYVQAANNYCQPGDVIVDVLWPPSGQNQTRAIDFVNQVYAFRLTIPLTFNPPLDITKTGFVRTAEEPGAPSTFRELTVSKAACDFHAPHGGYLYDDIGVGDTGPQFTYTVNNPGHATSNEPNFQPGDVIYVSIRNTFFNGGLEIPSCNGTAPHYCNLLFDFGTPNRP